ILSEAGDRAIDQPRVDRLQAVIVEPVLLQAVELEVLDQHVGGGGAPAHRLRAFRRGEIDGDRALAPVGRVIIGGRQVLAVRPGYEGRTQFARVVAAVRVLDLDHVRAEVGQHLAGPRTGKDAGELDDADTGEGWG